MFMLSETMSRSAYTIIGCFPSVSSEHWQPNYTSNEQRMEINRTWTHRHTDEKVALRRLACRSGYEGRPLLQVALSGSNKVQVAVSQVAKMYQDMAQESMLQMAHGMAVSHVHPPRLVFRQNQVAWNESALRGHRFLLSGRRWPSPSG